jgi:hypothetical protein
LPSSMAEQALPYLEHGLLPVLIMLAFSNTKRSKPKVASNCGDLFNGNILDNHYT